MTNFALQSHEIYRKLVAVVNIIPKTYRTAWMYLESSIGTNVTDTAESESNSPVELNEMLKTSTKLSSADEKQCFNDLLYIRCTHMSLFFVNSHRF